MFNIFNKKKVKKGVEHYLIEAFEAFESGDYPKAAKGFGMISQVVPEHPIANLMLGRAMIEMGKFEQAINALFRHLKTYPESVEALIYLGLTYYECGELEQAMERYEQALQLKADSVLVRENMAITNLSSGDLKGALDDLIELHEDNPNDASITELLVLALGRQGKWDAAKQYAHRLKNASIVMGLDS